MCVYIKLYGLGCLGGVATTAPLINVPERCVLFLSPGAASGDRSPQLEYDQTLHVGLTSPTCIAVSLYCELPNLAWTYGKNGALVEKRAR